MDLERRHHVPKEQRHRRFPENAQRQSHEALSSPYQAVRPIATIAMAITNSTMGFAVFGMGRNNPGNAFGKSTGENTANVRDLNKPSALLVARNVDGEGGVADKFSHDHVEKVSHGVLGEVSRS